MCCNRNGHKENIEKYINLDLCELKFGLEIVGGYLCFRLVMGSMEEIDYDKLNSDLGNIL